MANNFFVVGGEYADTSFTRLAEGISEERYGPFSEREAHDFWRGITGRTVDNAMVRYVIRREGSDESGRDWYVVGGEYADTSFQKMAAGVQFEIHGPFSRKDAMDFWRGITGRTVDNALCRYDVVTAAEVDVLKKTA